MTSQEVLPYALFGLIGGLLVLAVALLVRRPAHAGADRSPDLSATVMGLWEHRLAQMPQHSDLARFYERLALVEQGLSELRGLVTGMREMASRTEMNVKSLVQHAMDADARKGAD